MGVKMGRVCDGNGLVGSGWASRQLSSDEQQGEAGGQGGWWSGQATTRPGPKKKKNGKWTGCYWGGGPWLGAPTSTTLDFYHHLHRLTARG